MGMDLLQLLSGLAPLSSPIPATPNSSAVPAAPQGPQGDAPEQDLGAVMSPHQFRGMFGLHGGLRNILGTIGDAFLVQQGQHPVYAPRQQQEREANAMQHLQDNPMQAVQALSLVNPEASREMYHNIIRDNAYADEQRSQEATRAQTTEDRARAAFSALGGAANERTWPAVRQRLLAMRDAGHLDVPDELLPEQFSADVPGALIRLGTAPGTQMTADNLSDYRTRRLSQIDTHEGNTNQYHHALVGIGGRNANTNARRATIQENQGNRRLDIQDRRAGIAQAAETWNEAHPSRSRRNTAPAAAAPPPNPPTADGQTMRNTTTGQVWVGRGGRWMPQ